MRCLIVIASKEEHPKRYDRWLNELESLGISAKRINELNDLKEISTLALEHETGMKPEIQESVLIQAICLRCGETNSPAFTM